MSPVDDARGNRLMFAIPAGFALLLVGGGAGLVALGRHEEAVTASMRSWPSTMGTVSGSGFRDVRLQDGRWVQYADTGFRYSVDGRSYDFTTSEYAGSGNPSHERSLKYHANDPVRVFYDAANPSHGALTNDRSTPDFVLVLIGAIVCALSLPFFCLAAWMLVKERRASKRPAATTG
jgi:hypothetical protein